MILQYQEKIEPYLGGKCHYSRQIRLYYSKYGMNFQIMHEEHNAYCFDSCSELLFLIANVIFTFVLNYGCSFLLYFIRNYQIWLINRKYII